MVRDADDPRRPGVLVTVGDLVEDVIVWSDGPTRHATDNPCVVRRSRGGSAANVAAFASALMPARFIGCVGDDPALGLDPCELGGIFVGQPYAAVGGRGETRIERLLRQPLHHYNQRSPPQQLPLCRMTRRLKSFW